MHDQFPESDWKTMKRLSSVLLDRLHEKINKQVAAIAADRSISAVRRRLRIQEATVAGEEDVAKAFDDWRRSTALVRLLTIRYLGLLTDDEYQMFSPETRARIDSFLFRNSD